MSQVGLLVTENYHILKTFCATNPQFVRMVAKCQTGLNTTKLRGFLNSLEQPAKC